MSRLVPAVLVLALVLPFAAHAASSPWQENPHSSVRLVTPYEVAPRDGELWLGLHVRLAPHWHIYWKNSGDAGYPPAIDLSATPEVTESELLYPAPERYEVPGDLVAFGYEDEMVYPVRARIDAGDEERLEIAATVDYVVCEVECVPYGYDLVVEQRVGHEPLPDPETAGLLATWRRRLPRPVTGVPGIETEGRLDLSEPARPVLLVTVGGARAAPGEHPELFLEVHELFEPDEPVLEEAPDGLRFRVPLALKRSLEDPPESSPFAWTVTGLAHPEEPGEFLAVEARRAVPVTLDEGAAEPAAAGREGEGGKPGTLARLLPSAWAPAVVTSLAVAFLGLALWLWGILGPREEGSARSVPREALGFLAAAAVLGLLYLLSGRVPSEDLAFVELSLLGVGLAFWARSRGRRPAVRGVWTVLGAAAAVAAIWLAALA